MDGNDGNVRITTCRCGMVHCTLAHSRMLNGETGSMTIKVGVPFDPEKFSGDESQGIISRLMLQINAGSQIGFCDEGFCVRPAEQSPESVRDIVEEVIHGATPNKDPITRQFHALGKVCNGACGLCQCGYGAKVETRT